MQYHNDIVEFQVNDILSNMVKVNISWLKKLEPVRLIAVLYIKT